MYRLPTQFDFEILQFVNEETGEIFEVRRGESLQIENKSTKFDACFLTPLALGELGEVIYTLTYVKHRELSQKTWKSRELRAFTSSINKLNPTDITSYMR